MTEKTSPSSNIFLFYGEDDFSLRRKLDRWKAEFAKKYSASSISLFDGENLSETELIKNLQHLLEPSLFSSKKLIIIRDSLPKKADQAVLAEFLLQFIQNVPADNFLVFWQTLKIDRRLGFTKKFLASGINVTEFNLPHGPVLDQWIKAMAKTLGSEISDGAVNRLAQFLGRDLYEEKKAGGKVIERKEAFDLWQVYSELLKLSSNTTRIEPQDVNSLVKPKIPDSVFALTDEMIVKNQKGAFQALENFIAGATTEEKTTFIKVIGLLSEQLRSLLVTSLLQSAGHTNEQIAEKLGWSPGRVFITAKNLKNISVAKLKQLLQQLLLIDHRIKSSDSNTKLDIDLFLVSATG
ncbi:MAG: hypothetical protein WDN47_02680 [Candidatus Doudnabacteria bacterium]